MGQQGGGGGGAGAAGPGGAGGAGGAKLPQAQAPAGAPIPKPQDKAGMKAAAGTNIHIAINMLEEALPAFGAESDEGQKIMKALTTLGPLISKKDNSDLVPAEVLQMVRSMPQMGGGTDAQRMIMQMMQNGGRGQQQPQQQPQPGAQ